MRDFWELASYIVTALGLPVAILFFAWDQRKERDNEEEEMSGEVWYKVGPKDVFPETFEPFLLGHPLVREVFMKHHGDLLDPAFWQSHKERILAGDVYDIFPYERGKRFARRHQPEAPAREGKAEHA